MINQIEIHPYYNNNDLISFCQANGIIVEARSPFAHGDALKSFLKEPLLKRLASTYNKSIPQIILRWIIQKNVVVIVKCVNENHRHENIDVFDFELTSSDMESIDSLNKNLSFGFVSGETSLMNKVARKLKIVSLAAIHKLLSKND